LGRENIVRMLLGAQMSALEIGDAEAARVVHDAIGKLILP